MKLRMAKASLHANVIEPTFVELAQLADALWDAEQFAAAERIYLQAAAIARRQRRYDHETTALLFAMRMQDEAAKAA